MMDKDSRKPPVPNGEKQFKPYHVVYFVATEENPRKAVAHQIFLEQESATILRNRMNSLFKEGEKPFKVFHGTMIVQGIAFEKEEKNIEKPGNTYDPHQHETNESKFNSEQFGGSLAQTNNILKKRSHLGGGSPGPKTGERLSRLPPVRR